MQLNSPWNNNNAINKSEILCHYYILIINLKTSTILLLITTNKSIAIKQVFGSEKIKVAHEVSPLESKTI